MDLWQAQEIQTITVDVISPELENAPIQVLTLDRDRSEWIGSVPIQWKSVTDLALICHSAPSFVLSSAATAHRHRWHKAVTSLCRRLLCNHGLCPHPMNTCSGQRVGVRLSAWSASITCPPPTFCSLPAWSWAVNTSGGYRISKREGQSQTPTARGSRHRRRRGGSVCY